jgi:hypothetical protein
VGSSDIASLVTAILQFNEVQDVVNAIQVADKAVGSFDGVPLDNTRFASSPAATFEPRPVLHPEPRYLPREVIHPTPRYLPRPVLHPTPRIEAEIPPAAAGPEQPPRCSPPWLQPPWKILPWETPLPPRPIIKLIRYQPDIPNKGDLLDVFI